MEIEKTRETSWKIQLKNKSDNIEITSVEISGEVRIIKLTLINDENSVKVEMNKDEFFNFLSLIGAFKDVVIGEESLSILEDDTQKVQEVHEFDDKLYEISTKPAEKNLDNGDREELNPEEWDPW
ncbi:MAG: hypothetical protein ACFE75_11990 [Candidatus Hodarchaeota archaeon]